MAKWKVVATAVTFGKSSPEPLQRLEAAGCEVVLNHCGRPFTEAELIEAVADADALICGNDKVPGSVIRAGKHLKIVAKHGGVIWAEPAKQVGSVFCVELPLRSE
jgi:D-3-phosphoglycerate dehydrogenase